MPKLITTNLQALPPSNVEAEEAFLGSLFINPDGYYEVAQIVQPRDFFRETNQYVYQAFLALHTAGTPIDYVTMTDELKRRWPDVWPSGGPNSWETVCIGLLNAVPTSLNVASYAAIVKDYSLRRQMIAAAEQMATLAWDERADVQEALGKSEERFFHLRDRQVKDTVRSVAQVGDRWLDNLLNLRNGPALPDSVAKTDLLDLDRLMGGFAFPDLYMVAGRPGMGKSAFCIGVAASVAIKQKKPVLLFTLEMSEHQVMNRIVAKVSGVDSQFIRTGQLDDEQFARVLDAYERVRQAPLYIDDAHGQTPADILSKAMRARMRHGELGLVIVDHLMLVYPNSGAKNTPKHIEVADIARDLKMMAGPDKLGTPVLLASQLSRAVEMRADKRPNMTDLREAGEEPAFVVMALYRPGYYDATADQHVAELAVVKHREGATGTVSMYWRSTTASFHNLQRQEIKL